MNDELYKIQIEDVFEGPMDLLLYLIKKNEVDIYDIPIALITEQYLAYLNLMKLLNIDFAGDFLLMAATLTNIKSKLLLPVHDGEEDAEDPRQEILRPLMEYLQIKDAAEQLGKRELLGEHIFVRETNLKKTIKDPSDELIQVEIFELIESFQKILNRMTKEEKLDLTNEGLSIKDRMNQIFEILEQKKTITFLELFDDQVHIHDVVITFLALLEMVKLNLIHIAQNIQNGIIRVFIGNAGD